MPSCCVVASCSNKYAQSGDISYHKFPTDDEIALKWIRFCGRESTWKPSKWSSICSRHFSKSCFKDYLVKKCLKSDAVPSVLDDESPSSTPSGSGSKQGITVNNVTQINNASSLLFSPPQEETIASQSSSETIPEAVEEFIPEYEVPFEEDYEIQEHEFTTLEQIIDSLCRLCGGTFDSRQLVCYSSFLNLIIKCFPTLNLESYEYFPRQICFECRERLINFSIFIDKTMNAQKWLTDRLVLNMPTEIESKFIVPRIKQEPLVIIKEEKTSKLGLRDKINFKDSKTCEIIKIVSIPPAPVSAPAPKIESRIDDDIAILNPPMKVEEIMEEEDPLEHNYFKPHSKIEILEERVFKTEPLFSAAEVHPCSICHASLESAAALGRHIYEVHITAVKFCQPCDFGFVSTLDYLTHKLKVHATPKQRRKRCFCGRYLREGLLRQHAETCPAKRIRCRICQQGFRRTLELIRHACPLKTPQKPEAVRQQSVIQSTEEYRTSQDYEVIYVGKPPRPPPVPRYTCNECGRNFIRPSLRAQHESQHRSRSLWDSKCDRCGDLFDRKIDLIWHAKYKCEKIQRQEAPGGLVFRCSFCETSLSSIYSLRVHENTHTRRVKFECERCGKTFSTKQNLAQHQLTHSEGRNVKCTMCPRMFKRSGGMRQHLKSFHLKLKPHVCGVCKHAYALKADLMRCKHSALRVST